MQPITFKKIRENGLGYEEITVLSKDISRSIDLDSLKWADETRPGKVYEYEYLCLVKLIDGSIGLATIYDPDFDLLTESYRAKTRRRFSITDVD